jgi:cysteinyl-tRNA synthetase
MGLQLYNTLTREKETFIPLVEGKVGIYVCGPTVYGHSHLGHAKSYVSFDVLVRYLRYLGYQVTYVQNITDVGHLTDDADEGEDKLAVAAQKEKVHPMALAEYYTRSYFEDMDRLNLLRPDISPRATGHITEQVELTRTLIDKGFAYEADGSVYFDVAAFDAYGKLSGRSIEDMVSGTRVEAAHGKRHATDFALWKKAEPNHIMQWPSPWGMGYPGWHLECSVMSMKYLGKTIDIHGGGLENQFPHHECEIAQSEAANDTPFVRTWLHNNMVTVDGQKMGKSLNNFILLKQAFAGDHERLSQAYDPMAIRQFILSSHYRSPLDFSDTALHAAQSGYERIRDAVIKLRQAQAPDGAADAEVRARLAEQKDRFEAAMDDDLNTSVAVAVLFDMVKLANKSLGNGATRETLSAIETQFRRLGGDVLGIVQETYAASGGSSDALVADLIELLLEQRSAARKNKDFATSDRLRDRLTELGVILKDTPQGTEWSLA